MKPQTDMEDPRAFATKMTLIREVVLSMLRMRLPQEDGFGEPSEHHKNSREKSQGEIGVVVKIPLKFKFNGR